MKRALPLDGKVLIAADINLFSAQSSLFLVLCGGTKQLASSRLDYLFLPENCSFFQPEMYAFPGLKRAAFPCEKELFFFKKNRRAYHFTRRF